MMILADGLWDFGIGIRAHIGRFVTRQRQDDAGKVVARRRHGVLVMLAGGLDARPLVPEIDAGCRFDRVDDEGAADAGGGLEKHELRPPPPPPPAPPPPPPPRAPTRPWR